jgi:hypothetical protein
MPLPSWLLWISASALLAALSVWHYRRRETPGRGRMLLAALRAGAFALILLLLFGPELPGRGPAVVRGTQVLLDASLSMGMPAEADGESRWSRALPLARGRAGALPVLLFGERVRPVPAAVLPDREPGDGRSLLLPALQAAAEGGVRRVVVITDGGIEDAAAVARWAPRLGLEIVVEQVGASLANRSLVEVSAPPSTRAGEPVTVELGVLAPSGDSLFIMASTGGRVLGRVGLPAPGAGRIATGAMELRPDAPPGGGWVRIDLELEGTDPVPDDDRRTVYVHVSEDPAGVALVSLQPDWEPRFLAPVLERSLGLPLNAYIRTAPGQYARLAGGLRAGEAATEDEVRAAVERAELVVLHGIGDGAPEWALSALRTSRRLMIFPAAGAGAAPLPVAVAEPIAGDYYLTTPAPPSPIAPLLADQQFAAVAPLTALRAVDTPPGTWAPLLVARARQGAPQPAIVAGATAGRRWAVVVAEGFWQWSLRGGDERQLYTRLWSSLAGWIASDRATAGPAAVRPARLAAARGLPVAWIAPGLAADSVAIELLAEDGAVALDTVMSMTAGDTAFTAAPSPGTYSYRARAFADGTVTEGQGPLTVERYSPEFARARADLAALRTPPVAVRGEGARGVRGAGTPLHTTPYPWVVLVLLLGTEWILRRRWGLR